MSRLPRIAVGTLQPGMDAQAILWALLDAFCGSGVQVQSFLSQARFPGYPGAAAITGLSARHLDSWLMSPETCREVFVRGAEGAHLAVIEGEFDRPGVEARPGGRLEPLCRWLDLPRLAVLDAARLGPCRLPPRPDELDGILLDRIENHGHLARLATDLESLWGVPVLGALETLPDVRAELAAVPRGDRLPRELCQRLGDNFAAFWQPDRLLEIACRREMPRTCLRRSRCMGLESNLTVAIAYDEAFNHYFPDTLDLLEARGASVVDFSPLRDENLPPQADIVYFGCGHPERYAAVLSENHCMAASLRSHVHAGRRIYGEGGGAAYLCQQMETPEGELKRMAGVLPAIARLARGARPAEPLELILARRNWLGDRGARIRGYQNPHWHLEPAGNLMGFVAHSEHHYDIAGTFHSVGSLVHLNFAAMPSVLEHFFRPEPQPASVLTSWTASSPPI